MPAPPLQSLPGHGIAGTVQLPVMGLGTGKTAPLGDDAIAKAVAALPFAVRTPGGDAVSFPRLTSPQYASLRAELAVSPERAGVILPRYLVESEPARRALDLCWEAHLAARPEARVTFEKDLARFTAWLRGEAT